MVIWKVAIKRVLFELRNSKQITKNEQDNRQQTIFTTCMYKLLFFMKNINEYIDYISIFKDVVKEHLAMYPTAKVYFEDFLNISDNLPEKYKAEGNDLYKIITDLKSFNKLHEGICLESSSIDTDNNECNIVFFVDNSTNTENGYDADFYLWIFKIDLSDNIIIKYRNGY